MQLMYDIGLDVHKRKISCCVKDGSGQIHAEGVGSLVLFQKEPRLRSQHTRRRSKRITPALLGSASGELLPS